MIKLTTNLVLKKYDDLGIEQEGFDSAALVNPNHISMIRPAWDEDGDKEIGTFILLVSGYDFIAEESYDFIVSQLNLSKC